MCHIEKTFLLAILCAFTLGGRAQEEKGASIRARAEVHSNRVLLRWIPGNSDTWDLLNQYGVRLERLTVARSGVIMDKPELKVLAAKLKPQETDSLKQLVSQYPMGAVIAQAIFGEDFEASFGEHPMSKAISLDEMRQQRYLFSLYAADLCFPVAKEIGWGWEDREVKKNERYLYRITSLVPEKKRPISQGAAFVIAGEPTPFARPLSLSAQFSEDGALLSWDYNTLSHLYSAYFVEKSEDGKSFKRISDLPVTRMSDTEKNPHAPITYLDSIPLGKTIYYRVAGVTPFGSKGGYSDIVSGIAYPTLRAVPIITRSLFDKSGGAYVSWQFDDTQQELISGFKILHSADEKTYTILADWVGPQKRDYHIETIGKHIYYKVEARAKQGHPTRSLPILIQPVDSIPPGIPQGLSAQIDSLGAVHLSWLANKEPDIYGYRLYRGQTKGEELIPITDLAIRETSYTDSVHTDNLNDKVYYALTALDERYNQSDQSEIIEVLKPNTVPPAAPVITRSTAEGGKNIVEWNAGDDRYLAGFFIVRTDGEKSSAPITFRIENPATTRYEDKEITPGKAYLYQVMAYSTGNLRSSLSGPIKVKSLQGTLEGNAVKFTLKVLAEGIAIKWKVSSKDLISITLYKSDATNTRFLYRENLPASGELIDKEVFQGKENEYMLVVKPKGCRPLSIKKNLLL